IELEDSDGEVLTFESGTVQAVGEARRARDSRAGGPFEDVDVMDRELNEAAAAGLGDAAPPVAIPGQRLLRPHHAALVHEPRVTVDDVAEPALLDHVAQVVDQGLIEVA